MPSRQALIGFLSLLVACAVSRAQTAPAFEVASVKVLVRGPQRIKAFYDECHQDSFRSLETMFGLIAWAYDLRWPQGAEMEGQLPTWTTQPGGSFVIEAKAAVPVSEDDCRAMVRTLLADRFKLRIHREQKPGNFYELVLGPGPPKMARVDDSFKERGVFITINDQLGRGRPDLMRAQSMEVFTNYMGLWTSDGLRVIDKTGLEGEYKITLNFTTDPLKFSGPDLQTALQKQLGLKLERRKGMVEHFVLDHLERPTPN
jgi:uncharacterized protein (TIGR03435 family)